MRIAILSDIHGNLPALEAVVADIRLRGVDTVVNLGDNVSGPLLPLETAQFLMTQDWIHLAGNHERQLLHPACPRGLSDEYAFTQLTPKELSWLSSLKPAANLSPDIFLCHGTPKNDDEYFLETVEPARVRAATQSEIIERLGHVEAGLIICGHSHVPRSVHTSSSQLIVNPGSVGLPAYENDRPCQHVIETGSPDARYAIVERINGAWIVDQVSVPYPFKSAAELARLRQRPDWVQALLTGYVT
jgi:putative phosphoesterase